MADALTAREQRVSELQWLEMEVAVEGFEPFGRVACAVLQLEDFERALGLVFVEGGFEGEGLVIASGAKQSSVASLDCRGSFGASQ